MPASGTQQTPDRCATFDRSNRYLLKADARKNRECGFSTGLNSV